MENNFVERAATIIRECDKQYIELSLAGEFENIEEDIQGRDVISFKCAKCGLNHKSFILG